MIQVTTNLAMSIGESSGVFLEMGFNRTITLRHIQSIHYKVNEEAKNGALSFVYLPLVRPHNTTSNV